MALFFLITIMKSPWFSESIHLPWKNWFLLLIRDAYSTYKARACLELLTHFVSAPTEHTWSFSCSLFSHEKKAPWPWVLHSRGREKELGSLCDKAEPRWAPAGSCSPRSVICELDCAPVLQTLGRTKPVCPNGSQVCKSNSILLCQFGFVSWAEANGNIESREGGVNFSRHIWVELFWQGRLMFSKWLEEPQQWDIQWMHVVETEDVS